MSRIDEDLRVQGWRQVDAAPGLVLWLKGHCYSHEDAALAAGLSALKWDSNAVAEFLKGLDGHYAMIARREAECLAVADRVRSVPILFGQAGDGSVRVGASAPAVLPELAPRDGAIHRPGALAVAMAGYTIGDDTIHEGLRQLRAGEYLIASGKGAPVIGRHDLFSPWAAPDRAEEGEDAEARLRDVTLAILEKMAASVRGRPIVLPLSAGYDSRAIASGLKEIGVSDVRCICYGVEGNFEAEASRRIAERLGYEWRFVPTNTSRSRGFYATETFRRFQRFVDDGASMPFIQDVGVLHELSEAGWLDADSVLVNGNSGDFISGNHIPKVYLQGEPGPGDVETRRRRILDSLVGKHFRLWRDLADDANDGIIAGRLARELEALPFPADPAMDFGFCEFLEFQDRQAKHVIAGQRAYEFLGLDWRLPLWDCAYLDYWQRAPLRHKAGQQLYCRMLENCNWGGVWDIVPLNRRSIRPHWVRPLRWLGKAACLPFGRAAWHRMERRLFDYWMSNLNSYAIVPYLRVAMDRRGARHAGAWVAADYLHRQGLAHDGGRGRS